MPTDKGGLFGIPVAVSETIEEQGRNRLHVHILIWNNKTSKNLSELFQIFDTTKMSNRQKTTTKRKLEQCLIKNIDRISSTDIVENIWNTNNLSTNPNKKRKIFQHKCSNNTENYQLELTSNQTLREMRDKVGWNFKK